MLERLERHTPPASETNLFAKTQLAEVLISKEPWRAAILCREVLRHCENDRAWGVLGLAHSVLGNFRSATRAYRRALSLNPSCPSYSHNLGHLIDVAFGRPRQALPLLRAAYEAQPGDIEIAASYAHALLRCGQSSAARRVLVAAVGSAEAESLLARWTDVTGDVAEHAIG